MRPHRTAPSTQAPPRGSRTTSRWAQSPSQPLGQQVAPQTPPHKMRARQMPAPPQVRTNAHASELSLAPRAIRPPPPPGRAAAEFTRHLAHLSNQEVSGLNRPVQKLRTTRSGAQGAPPVRQTVSPRMVPGRISPGPARRGPNYVSGGNALRVRDPFLKWTPRRARIPTV